MLFTSELRTRLRRRPRDMGRDRKDALGDVNAYGAREGALRQHLGQDAFLCKETSGHG
jgi:hypothetical protein